MKSIEMQVALPRTVDAGKIQENINKQGQHMQESLTHAQREQDAIKRRKISGNEETARLDNDRKGQAQDGSGTGPESGKRESSEETAPASHPYLGTKVDFSG